jgi:hypothetical protein
MTSAALARPPSLFESLRGGATLDELVAGAWHELAAGRTGECPACGGELAPVYGAHARPVAGRCGDCAAVLS